MALGFVGVSYIRPNGLGAVLAELKSDCTDLTTTIVSLNVTMVYLEALLSAACRNLAPNLYQARFT